MNIAIFYIAILIGQSNRQVKVEKKPDLSPSSELMIKDVAALNNLAFYRKGAYKQPLKALLPYGMLATKKWLQAKGMSVHAIDNAVKTETLLLLTSGVYSQYTRSLTWEGVVSSMQRIEMDTGDSWPKVTVGGLTAMALSGFSQYLELNSNSSIHLYSQTKLPAWLSRLTLPLTFQAHITGKLWVEGLLENQTYIKQHQWAQELPPLYFSCPEKAILELLMDVPNHLSFEHADELMQGLVNLSPRKLNGLLTACKNIKVKRLFFWLAERHGHPWLSKLPVANYDLGSGKRVIAKAGKLNTKYLMTVPSSMA